MLDTKLVFVEGLPGAGKSTTAEYLAMYLQQHGIPCRWFHELDETNPIPDLDVGIDQYPQKMVAAWRNFAKQAVDDGAVTIIESRLWQNSAMFMYMSTFSEQDVHQFNQQGRQRTPSTLACAAVFGTR